MGKTRDLLKKIRDTKGTFHENMGPIKDIHGMDLREAEGIKERWKEYTEEPSGLYRENQGYYKQLLCIIHSWFYYQKCLGEDGENTWVLKCSG